MGLGGAVYFTTFSIPLIIGTGAYQIVLALIAHRIPMKISRRLILAFWIPFVVIAVVLIIFCPMDTNQSFVSYFWDIITGKK